MKPKDRLIRLLDQVESHVERLRKDAVQLEEEKDNLMSTLDSLRNSELIDELDESTYSSMHEFQL